MTTLTPISAGTEHYQSLQSALSQLSDGHRETPFRRVCGEYVRSARRCCSSNRLRVVHSARPCRHACASKVGTLLPHVTSDLCRGDFAELLVATKESWRALGLQQLSFSDLPAATTNITRGLWRPSALVPTLRIEPPQVCGDARQTGRVEKNNFYSLLGGRLPQLRVSPCSLGHARIEYPHGE